MKKILNKLVWYIKLWGMFMKLSLASQLEYRLNFIAGAFVEMAFLCIKLVYLVIISKAGYETGAIMIFIGTYVFMTGIWMLLAGVNGIPQKVISGELDILMTKPGSLQFLQTFGSFDFAMTFPNVVAGLVLIIIGWSNAEIPLSLINLSGFVFYILSGMVMTYSFALMSSLLVFWVTSRDAVGTLYAALWDFNNMPMMIFPKLLQQIGTFIIPMFVITNWSGLFIMGKLDPLRIIYGAVIPVVVFVLARVMWRRGIGRYYSANS